VKSVNYEKKNPGNRDIFMAMPVLIHTQVWNVGEDMYITEALEMWE
jgi:hypothetical protein